MPALIALALSVGVLAVLDTWLYVGPLATFLPGLIWISFIAWGCHFHSGGTLALPIAVGLGAATICLSSAIGLLQTIPASVYGFASIAGPIALANVPAEQAIIPTVVSIVIGAAFGYVSEMLANALTKKGDVSAEATADPGHA